MKNLFTLFMTMFVATCVWAQVNVVSAEGTACEDGGVMVIRSQATVIVPGIPPIVSFSSPTLVNTTNAKVKVAMDINIRQLPEGTTFSDCFSGVCQSYTENGSHTTATREIDPNASLETQIEWNCQNKDRAYVEGTCIADFTLYANGAKCKSFTVKYVHGDVEEPQKGILVLPAPRMDGCHTQMSYASRNGEWATGGVYDGSTYQAFRWNTCNNEFEFLNVYGPFSFGYGVTNDGVVVGEFASAEVTSNGAEIESPCIWYGGKWHVLDHAVLGTIDAGVTSLGAARCVTPDGRYVAGALSTEHGWNACIWTIGKDMQSSISLLPMEENGVAEHMSDDATVVGGFDQSKSIRMPAYWTATAGKYAEVVPDGRKHTGQWTITNGVSPDGRYVATWNKLYDLRENTCIQFDQNTNVDAASVAGVTSNGVVYGQAQKLTSTELAAYAAYYHDGKWYSLQEMLVAKGAELPTGCKLTDLRYMSDDEKIYFVNATYPNGLTAGIMIKMDENVTTRPPVSVTAKQMSGLATTSISWKAPIANAEAVTGYIVYRDGVEVYKGTELGCKDRQVEIGKTYTYTVKAMYGSTTGEESEPATVTLKALSLAAPANLTGRQTGISKVRLAWDAAGTNLPSLQYYEEGRQISSFGGGQWDIEAGVRFRNDDLKMYEGMAISEVSFYPMSAQKSWTINFYTGSGLNGEPFYSEAIDASTLLYGQKNTIRLAHPVEVPEKEDVVVGIAADVASASYNVIGLAIGDNDAGYNDLIRQPGTPFVSLYLDALENGLEYPYSWPISLGMASKGGAIASLEGYKLYQDGQAIATVPANTCKYVIPTVEDGNHTYTVSAVYTNSRESEAAQAKLAVAHNDEPYKVSDIVVRRDESMKATATWRAPMDDEKEFMGYCTEKYSHGMQTTAADGYSFQAATLYPYDMLAQYVGDYQISGIRFYPVGDAEYSMYLNGSNGTLWSIELERGADYILGTWNTIWLDKPISIDGKDTEYQLIADCYDGDAEKPILGMDGNPAKMMYSDLFSLDDGVTWSSYETEVGARGNWMMGLIITCKDQKPLPVQSYKVYWDGADSGETIAAGAELTAWHQYANADKEKMHNVKVAAIYGAADSDVMMSRAYDFGWKFLPTGVQAPTASQHAKGDVYDIMGRKVSNPTKGVYIKGNKKILVK